MNLVNILIQQTYFSSPLVSLQNKNNLLPGYLKNEIPVDIPHLHDTRYHRDSWIITRTNKYKYRFFPHSVNSWSSLSNLVPLVFLKDVIWISTRLMLILFLEFTILWALDF